MAKSWLKMEKRSTMKNTFEIQKLHPTCSETYTKVSKKSFNIKNLLKFKIPSL
jgi:hypothetical protein